MANDMADMYDEGTDLDQEGNIAAADKEKEDTGYESFLAPKSAFKGDISPGTIHRVRIERALDEELELKCIEGTKDEPENEDNTQEESDEMYQ